MLNTLYDPEKRTPDSPTGTPRSDLPSIDVAIRIAQSHELGQVLAAYRAWGYGAGIAPDDITWVAEAAGELVGTVRIAPESGTLVLRGMQIAEPWRGHAIGRRMLSTVTSWLDGRECYCVPYAHLAGFYGRAGFVELALSAAPPFLAARLTEYRRRALKVIIMKRPAP